LKFIQSVYLVCIHSNSVDRYKIHTIQHTKKHFNLKLIRLPMSEFSSARLFNGRIIQQSKAIKGENFNSISLSRPNSIKLGYQGPNTFSKAIKNRFQFNKDIDGRIHFNKAILKPNSFGKSVKSRILIQ